MLQNIFSIEEYRSQMIQFIANFFNLNSSTNEIRFHYQPYFLFEWKKPSLKSNECGITHYCLSILMDSISSSDFLVLLSALYQEFRVLVYGRDIERVTSLILCLHFLIRPIKWVSTSISYLPESLFDYLDSPNSYFYGIMQQNKKTEILEPNTILIDIESKTHTASTKPIPLPGNQESIFSEFWRSYDNVKQTTVESLSYYIKTFTNELLKQIPLSIITSISSPEVVSSFIEKLYLRHFPRDWRNFVYSFVSTQMMMLDIEHESGKIEQEKKNNVESLNS
jgi:hypothetical protein